MHKTYSTIETYKRYLRRWVVPRWGAVALADTKAVAAEEWLSQLGDKYALANGTLAKINNVMKAVWRHGQRHEFVPQGMANPFQFVRQSAASDRVPMILTVEQVGEIIEHLKEPVQTMVLLDASTGLRVSELLGLKWRDVEFERLEMHVRRAVVYAVVAGASRRSRISRCPSIR